MREKGQTEVAKTLETPVFSRGIEILTEKFYFGEMTFTPQSGIGKWDPPEFNYLYGRMLNLPNHDPGDPA